MFHFADDDQQNQDHGQSAGDRIVGRIMAAEYNLAVQRQGAARATPTGILAQILGELLQERAAR
jgi:hypothetical protein